MTTKFPRALYHGHTPALIRQRLDQTRRSLPLRDLLYGALDGMVTTFAIVAGVSGAELSTMTVIILGVSNVFADGFSMAAGNYLGTKSDLDAELLIREFEKKEIASGPHGEEEEVRQIFMRKGFSGEVLEKIVSAVTEDKRLWLKTMITEEYGISDAGPVPMRSAGLTFSAFIVCGMVPLTPFLTHAENPFLWSTIGTIVAFFILGAWKSRWSLERWWVSGAKTFFLGATASGIAYLAGRALK